MSAILQPIYDIAEICYQQGVSESVVCPGSRCAPLTLAFARHPKINTRTFSDERSAAFIAMGMAQQLNTPTVLVCTSGSAAYNFSPAVAESFFQQVPLLVFTADRPKEWIDQLDGQTIRQSNLFGNHVKKTYDLPEDLSHADAKWYVNRVINEAIILSQEFPKGPVHINIPFREPFYPSKDSKISASDSVRTVLETKGVLTLSSEDLEKVEQDLARFSKVLIVVGQADYSESLVKAVERFTKHHHAAVLGDVISNFHSLPSFIKEADVFLGQCDSSVKESLQPELLITFGKSVLSKNIKQFLRKYKPQEHWHLQPGGLAADTFQQVTRIFRTDPLSFFEQLVGNERQEGFSTQKKNNFTKLWEAEEHRTQRSKLKFFQKESLDDLNFLQQLLNQLPSRCNLHLANSMSVRYVNLLSLSTEQKGVRVFVNRGTSGIDGCTSTAVGHALVSEVPNLLITGDMAFFYDRNAFWHNYTLPNLHVVVLNNHGGVIFNLIDGPSELPELKEYFVTTQALSAQHLAGEFNFDFIKIDTAKKIQNGLKEFWGFDGKTKILEIETSTEANKKSFELFKATIKKGYEVEV